MPVRLTSVAILKKYFPCFDFYRLILMFYFNVNGVTFCIKESC